MTENPLLRKLRGITKLSAEDIAAIERASATAMLRPARTDLIKEGERPDSVFLLLDGWACRYKLLADGSRQIVAFMLPGDLCDMHFAVMKQMDHSVGLLCPARVAEISQRDMLALLRDHPSVAQGLFWATLVGEATMREWLVSLGQRDSYERIAHLFCELWTRLRVVGKVKNNRFAFPLTQEQLADTLGLTAVHVNRVLQRLRAEGLVTLAGKQLTIEDIDELKRIAGFDPDYLHLERRG